MKNLLRALFSKAAPKTPDKQSQTANIVKNRTTHEHPSKGLTPQSLHRILEDAENGDIQAQSELFVDIEEKDGHIFSEMSKRKRAVIGLDWNIVPPPNSSEAERKLAEEVDGWLNQMTDLEDMMF